MLESRGYVPSSGAEGSIGSHQTSGVAPRARASEAALVGNARLACPPPQFVQIDQVAGARPPMDARNASRSAMPRPSHIDTPSAMLRWPCSRVIVASGPGPTRAADVGVLTPSATSRLTSTGRYRGLVRMADGLHPKRSNPGAGSGAPRSQARSARRYHRLATPPRRDAARGRQSESRPWNLGRAAISAYSARAAAGLARRQPG